MVFELLFEIFERRGTFAAADDLAVAFGSEQVDAESAFGAVFVHLEVKSLDRGREVMDKNRLAELVRQIRLVRRAKIAAPFEIVLKLALCVALLQHLDGIVVMQTRERGN